MQTTSAHDFRRCRGVQGRRYKAASARGPRDSNVGGKRGRIEWTDSRLGPRPWAELGYREEMRGPSRQKRCLKVELRFRWPACRETIEGRKLMFTELLLCSIHCDMCQRDINRCGPSHERPQDSGGRQPCLGVPLTVIQVRGQQS